MKKRHLAAFIVAFAFFCVSLQIHAESRNGFNLDEALIPIDEIHFGGPPKDGIPALA